MGKRAADDSGSSGSLPAPSGLGDALQLLLIDREPHITSEPSNEAGLTPGAHWPRVVHEVIDQLLFHDGASISDVFNTLAGAPPRLDYSLRQNEKSEPARDSQIGERSQPRPPVRITITAPQARSLRVIGSLPGFPLCQLEGRNGIGKTLAARLLELVTGRQPFAALPHAWSTLRDQLGPTKISVFGLRAGALEFVLNPSDWPTKPEQAAESQLGIVTLNGKQISWTRAHELLRVVRIAGDESLVDALSHALEERAQQALLLQPKIASRLADWDEPLYELSQMTESLSPRVVVEALESARVAGAASDVAISRASLAHEATGRARKVYDALQSTMRRWIQAPDLLATLDDTNAKLGQNLREQTAASEALIRVSKELGLDESRRAEVSKWERLRGLRRRAVERASADERLLLRHLGFERRVTDSELRAQLKQIGRDLQEAQQELAELDVMDDVRQLAHNIERRLEHVSATILRQVIAMTARPITGAQLLKGLHRRRTELEERPTPGEVDAARQRMRLLQNRQQTILNLQESMLVTDRKAANLQEAQERLASLLSRLEGATHEAYEHELNRIRDLQEEQATLLHHRDMARRQLAELLGMPVPDISQDRSSADEAEESEERVDYSPETDLELDDGLGLPTDSAAWAQLLSEAAAGTQDLLESLGVPIFPESLVTAESNHAEAQLSELIEQATRRVSECHSVQLDLMAEAAAATARSEAEWNNLTQLRLRLRLSCRALLEDEGEWSEWQAGLDRLLGAVSGPDAMSARDIDVDAPFDDELSDTELRAAEWLTNVSWLVDRISSAANAVRDGLDSIAGILQALARELSTRSRASVDREQARPDRGLAIHYLDQERIRHWAENELGSLLNAEALRKELFGSAERVTLDLQSATVHWTVPGDQFQSRRPLEAFSSGEQVFAYTRARLEQLRYIDGDDVQRIVILDEFGAFVARNRFAQLLQFVRQQALGSIADQVVVMLPLSADLTNESYAEELIRATDDPSRRSELLSRVEQVRDSGYFAVPVGSSAA